MATKPAELVQKLGISRVYAWQLLEGKRQPSLELALRIYGATGVQLGRLAGLTPDEIRDVQDALGKLVA